MIEFYAKASASIARTVDCKWAMTELASCESGGMTNEKTLRVDRGFHIDLGMRLHQQCEHLSAIDRRKPWSFGSSDLHPSQSTDFTALVCELSQRRRSGAGSLLVLRIRDQRALHCSRQSVTKPDLHNYRERTDAPGRSTTEFHKSTTTGNLDPRGSAQQLMLHPLQSATVCPGKFPAYRRNPSSLGSCRLWL